MKRDSATCSNNVSAAGLRVSPSNIKISTGDYVSRRNEEIIGRHLVSGTAGRFDREDGHFRQVVCLDTTCHRFNQLLVSQHGNSEMACKGGNMQMVVFTIF